MSETVTVSVSEVNDVVSVAVSDVALGGVPVGGTTGQVLTKESNADFDTAWSDAPAVAASAVTVDTTGFKVVTDTDLQTHLASNDTKLLNARTTGIRFGGRVSVDGGAGIGATFSVTAGAGQILDNTDAENPSYFDVTFSAASTQATAGEGLNYVYIDNAGALSVTTSEPTYSQLFSRIYLSRLNVRSGIITGINSIVNPVQQEGQTLSLLAAAIGPIRLSGRLINPNGANLNFLIEAGDYFSKGANYSNSYITPDVVTESEFNTNTGDEFEYRLPDNTVPVSAPTTTIDAGYYAPGGVRTLIPGATSRVGKHYIFEFVSPEVTNIRIVYGDEFYNSLDIAQNNVSSVNALELAPAPFENAFIKGVILITGDCTDLNDATRCRIINGDRFGNF